MIQARNNVQPQFGGQVQFSLVAGQFVEVLVHVDPLASVSGYLAEWLVL
jgi:hypothetical protein